MKLLFKCLLTCIVAAIAGAVIFIDPADLALLKHRAPTALVSSLHDFLEDGRNVAFGMAFLLLVGSTNAFTRTELRRPRILAAIALSLFLASAAAGYAHDTVAAMAHGDQTSPVAPLTIVSLWLGIVVIDGIAVGIRLFLRRGRGITGDRAEPVR